MGHLLLKEVSWENGASFFYNRSLHSYPVVLALLLLSFLLLPGSTDTLWLFLVSPEAEDLAGWTGAV